MQLDDTQLTKNSVVYLRWSTSTSEPEGPFRVVRIYGAHDGTHAILADTRGENRDVRLGVDEDGEEPLFFTTKDE